MTEIRKEDFSIVSDPNADMVPPPANVHRDRIDMEDSISSIAAPWRDENNQIEKRDEEQDVASVARYLRDEISAIRSEILCAKTVIQAHKERPPESVQPQTQTSSKKGHKHHFTWTDLDISTQADYIHQTFSGVVAVGGRLENLGTAMKAARMSDAMYRILINEDSNFKLNIEEIDHLKSLVQEMNTTSKTVIETEEKIVEAELDLQRAIVEKAAMLEDFPKAKLEQEQKEEEDKEGENSELTEKREETEEKLDKQLRKQTARIDQWKMVLQKVLSDFGNLETNAGWEKYGELYMKAGTSTGLLIDKKIERAKENQAMDD